MIKWDDEKVELLRSYWQTGLTCRQMADKLGVGLGSVTGKASRIGLPKRNGETSIRRNKPKIMSKTTLFRQVIPQSKKLVKIPDLQPHHCRYAFHDPKDPRFGFCGDKAEVGSYCLTHFDLCHTKKLR